MIMPIGTYVSMQWIISLTIPSILVVLAQLAPPGGPGTQDAWSVLGAMVASVIVMHRESRSGTPMSFWKGPSLSSFLASAFVGSIGPGLVINTVLPFCFDGFMTKLGTLITWHGWAGLGLAFGLSGSWLVKGWIALSTRFPSKMESEADRRWGIVRRNHPDWIDTSNKKEDDTK